MRYVNVWGKVHSMQKKVANINLTGQDKADDKRQSVTTGDY